MGEGYELVFRSGPTTGSPEGHVYFEDDFSWVTDVYGGTDYIGTWPTPLTAEQYWNGVTAAAFGDEAYNTLINSGWVTDDNKLKERVYLRVGYIKMGRGRVLRMRRRPGDPDAGNQAQLRGQREE